jgi:hypothetical protein
MVWSPLSNLLLYGQTTDVTAAKQAGVPIALGSDWSVSGSKGLLGELKAARLASNAAPGGPVFSDKELVAMATRTPATILKWDQKLGSLQPGRYADLLVINGTSGDPYTTLVDARDSDIVLVVIAGTARYGSTIVMRALVEAAPLEDPGGAAAGDRLLNLQDATADPVVAGLTLAESTNRLTEALADLPNHPAPAAPAAVRADAAPGPRWQLALDEIHPTGAELRPRLPLPGHHQPSGPLIQTAAAVPVALTALALDGLTATQDPAFSKTLTAEANLTDAYRASLAGQLT